MRRVSLVTGPAAAVLLLALAACSSAVSGHGIAASGSGAPSRFPSSTSVPAVPTAPASASAAAAALVPLLESPPSGAHPWGTDWSNNVTPTVAEFISHFYDPDQITAETARLTSDGLIAVAHQTWVGDDHDQIDLILTKFSGADGADIRYTGIVGATASDLTLTQFAIPGHASDAVGFVGSTVDADGYLDSRAYAHTPGSTIVIEAFYFSPKPFAKGDLLTWLDKQISLAH